MLKIHLKAVLYKSENGTHCFVCYIELQISKLITRFYKSLIHFLKKFVKNQKTKSFLQLQIII